MADTGNPTLRRKAVPCTVLSARIIAYTSFAYLRTFNGEGKAQTVAVSSVERLIRVVDRWFIRVLEAENEASRITKRSL
jgi:hypothetical protein